MIDQLYPQTEISNIICFQEYKNITRMRLSFITSASSCPSLFTVVVRGIPWSPDESYGVIVDKFFSNYYASSYLSHQVVYHSGTVQKLMVRIVLLHLLVSNLEK